MTRTEVERIRREEFTSAYLNKGAFNDIKRSIGELLDDENFTDDYLTEEFKQAVRDYVSGKRLFLFLNDFTDTEHRQLAIAEWINRKFVEQDPFLNAAKSELLLRTFFIEGNHVNYVTWNDEGVITVHKVVPLQNSQIYDALIDRVNAAIESGDYSGLFTDSFLSTIITEGYTFEEFKRLTSTNISKSLFGTPERKNWGVQISLSEDFLGLNGNDGPLKLVEEDGGYRLNKEFPDNGVTNNRKIPADKIEKFKELTKWEQRTFMFKMPPDNVPEGDETYYFDKESIENFAVAIKGKDLEQNEFKFYNGEIYDEWGKAFDADYWSLVGLEYSKQVQGIGSVAWNTVTDTVYDVAITIGIVGAQSVWAASSAFTTMTSVAVEGAFASLAASGVAGSTATAATAATATTTATATAATATTTATATASATGALAGYYGALKTAGGFILKAAKTPVIWLALANLALIWSLGFAIVTANKESQNDKLRKLLVRQYMQFLAAAIVDLSSGVDAEGIGKKFRAIADDEEFLRYTLSIFALDKEVERRVRLFSRIVLELNKNENFLNNVSRVEEAIADSNRRAFADIDLPEIQELTDEEIADRQRFYKQCALMMNMHLFAPEYEKKVQQRIAGDEKPFDGRFWRVTSKNKERLLNNMFSSEDSQYFFEAPTHVVTQLTPKLRLYKVFNEDDGTLTRTEFIFPTHTDLSRKKNFATNQTQTIEVATEKTVPSFFESSFDKGDGMGLKSFTLEFNGTNPAEARNDVKGTMVLFFQSFADFVRERVSTNGKSFRFVDLIVHPKPAPDGKVQGIEVISKRQYEPEFYRIMAEVGYILPTDFQGLGADKAALMNAVKNTNKSYYLTMVDHDFTINNDGTVQVTLTYRAYIESALKSLKFDALTTPELAEKRISNQTKLAEVASKKVCTKEELKDIKVLLSSIEEEVLKDSLNSIMRRLFERDKVYTVNISDEDRKFFLINGYYQKCDLTTAVDLSNNANRNSGDLGIVLNTRLPETSADYNFADADENDTLVQFFFFGDLLHTILDSMYDPQFGGKLSIGMENTKIVLGSFDFETFHNSQETTNNEFNISQIPISVEFFSRWFVDNVLSQKSTRRSFPILNFIRNLSNSLVSNSLLELCVNRDVESRLIFQTAQMSAYREAGDLIGKLTHKDRMIVDTDIHRGSRALPLEGSATGDSKIEHFHHYMILNPNGSTRSHGGTGIYSEDVNAGVYHMEIGSNRGIVKKVNFSKTDQQYLREARFMRRGIDGLMQLGSVYNVDIEMYGNSIFYPGMDIWLNPFGFGGASLGRPQTGREGARSLANILGIGGYHTITSVYTNLTPGSFTTNLKAMYYYSGDGELDYLSPQQNLLSKTDSAIIEEFAIEGNGRAEDAAEACRVEIVNLQNFRDPDQQIEPRVEEEAESDE